MPSRARAGVWEHPDPYVVQRTAIVPVSYEHCHLDDVVHTSAGSLDDRPHVQEHVRTLCRQVVGHHLRDGIQPLDGSGNNDVTNAAGIRDREFMRNGWNNDARAAVHVGFLREDQRHYSGRQFGS